MVRATKPVSPLPWYETLDVVPADGQIGTLVMAPPGEREEIVACLTRRYGETLMVLDFDPLRVERDFLGLMLMRALHRPGSHVFVTQATTLPEHMPFAHIWSMFDIVACP